jgi:hypothetical protein
MPQKSSKSVKRRTAARFPAIPILVVSLLAVAIVAVAVLLTTRGDEVDSAAPVASGEWDATPYAGGPRLAVDQHEIDHGDVAYGQQVDGVYRMRNVGDAPLQIARPFVVTREGC